MSEPITIDRAELNTLRTLADALLHNLDSEKGRLWTAESAVALARIPAESIVARLRQIASAS